MQTIQPSLVSAIAPTPSGLTWLFARDGALTATRNGKWWADNSLPAKSAEAMLKDVTSDVAVTCVVAPTHAAQLRVLLDRVSPSHAIVVVQPDASVAHVALHCEDLADAITAKRLWWTIGTDWAAQLERLLTEQPGLPIPGRFVRTPDVDADVADAILPEAQGIFGRHMAKRAQQIATLRISLRRKGTYVKHIAVVAPSRFRLWSNGGSTLARTLAATTPQHVAADWRTIDTDDPTAASPLAVAQAASDCDAIVMADSGRSDNPNLLATDLPWITWVTGGRIPDFAAAGPNDRLLLADQVWRTGAIANGWPTERLAIASQPAARRRPAPTKPAHLAILADIPNLAPPAFTTEFSSHRLVWEAIGEQLTTDPFAVGTDVNDYLYRKLRNAGIDPASVDRLAFIDGLILPAFTVGVAGVLLEAQVPLTLHGAGWDATLCRDHARGPVHTRQAFDAIVNGATALVRPWPVVFAHEIDATGRLVLTVARSRSQFIADARAMLEDAMPPETTDAALRAEQVLCGLS